MRLALEIIGGIILLVLGIGAVSALLILSDPNTYR